MLAVNYLTLCATEIIFTIHMGKHSPKLPFIHLESYFIVLKADPSPMLR